MAPPDDGLRRPKQIKPLMATESSDRFVLVLMLAPESVALALLQDAVPAHAAIR